MTGTYKRVARCPQRGHRKNRRPLRQTAFATNSASTGHDLVDCFGWGVPVSLKRAPALTSAPSQIIWWYTISAGRRAHCSTRARRGPHRPLDTQTGTW